MKSMKKKIILFVTAGVILTGTMSTAVFAEENELLSQDTVWCEEHNDYCPAGSDCDNNHERNHHACQNTETSVRHHSQRHGQHHGQHHGSHHQR